MKTLLSFVLTLALAGSCLGAGAVIIAVPINTATSTPAPGDLAGFKFRGDGTLLLDQYIIPRVPGTLYGVDSAGNIASIPFSQFDAYGAALAEQQRAQAQEALAVRSVNGYAPDATGAATIPQATATTPGLMSATQFQQVGYAARPMVVFTIPAGLPIGLMANTTVATLKAPRAGLIQGYAYQLSASAGTSLAASFSISVNGQPVANTGSQVTLSTLSNEAAVSVAVGKGDFVELKFNVTAQVGVTFGVGGGYFIYYTP